MNCNEARKWFGAQLDGELDLGRDAEVTAHVQGCAACATLLEQQRAWRETLREKLPRAAVPAGLAERIRAQVGDAGTRAGNGAETVKGKFAESTPVRRSDWAAWMGGGFGIAAALALAFVGGEWRERRARIGDELVSAHALAVVGGNSTEVLSSDRHTVKPWMAEHLDFSPPVNDFAAEGFPLLGGRVERLQGQRVAALVYQRHKHVITVYVAPAERVSWPTTETRRGYHVRVWRDGDLSFAAVSDLELKELDSFVARCRQELK